MAKYELCTAVADSTDPLRKQEGDLIAVIPYNAQWGSAVIGSCFIIIVNAKMRY